jgi:hypothetical protein
MRTDGSRLSVRGKFLRARLDLAASARGACELKWVLPVREFQGSPPHSQLQKAGKGSLLLLDFVVLGQSQRARTTAATIPTN